MKTTGVAVMAAGWLVLGSAAMVQAGKDPKKEACKAKIKEQIGAKAPEWAKAADADGDGSLTMDEYGALLTAAKKASKEIAAACEKECGIVKAEKPAAPKAGEPAKAAAKPKDPAKEAAKAAEKAAKKAEEIKPWDKNGDGKLDEAEAKAKKEAADKEKLAKAYKKADKDGDGKVSVAEGAAAVS